MADASEKAKSLATITLIPERRRRPFVGPDGDQSAAAAAASHVGDDHDGQHRQDQHEDPVAGRVVDRPDVVAEQVGVPDLGALHTAGVVAVLEQHQLDRRPRPSVTIARLIPLVRTAGRPKMTPSGTAAATPASSPSRNGMSKTATSRPAT